ncbi:SPFH domain-containing protein [Hyalangium rubrum]|uniref:SPFH domain-containing protein n=1 Tax=Hyalangium rubrum TaxID=3103134 RepID=A0ABU5H9Z9_9BACT|nr:SPFH domain-containing protein [Hyalangium sp. s54d21]MDY7229679.1 SPFH domain-containing protein [Hyalangium sp. s54d21]
MSANEKQIRMNGTTPAGNGTDTRVQLVKVDGGASGQRYDAGWRAGKPEEDPEKMKKWGLITARPSEFLIHMRRGRVREVSGQGASCFKLPGDAVAIVPTSVQRLQFTADQVTSEKVGVQVTGLAVYRIVDPLVAFRMLNFSFPERASEKLQELLREMFVGAARRLVANLSVEECLTRRKEGIAEELMREIAPVVSGRGRLDDKTDSGWGVVLDTIEIQDVRVLSSTVFENMQARYRREQERQAREAELAKERFLRREEAEAERAIALTKLAADEEVRHKRQETEEQARLEELASEERVSGARLAQERTLKQGEAATEREVTLAKLNAEAEVRQRKQQADEAARLEQLATEARVAESKLAQDRTLKQAQAAAERELALNKLNADLELRQRKLEAEEKGKLEQLAGEARLADARLAHERAVAEAQIAHERAMAGARAEAELDRIRHEQEAASARHEAQLEATMQEVERIKAQVQVAQARRAIAEAELAIAELEVKKERVAQELELGRAKEMRAIENTLSPEVIQMTLAQQLPQVAAAFQQKMGEVHVTAVDGANPFGYIAAAVEGVMGLARSAGLKIPNPAQQPQ